MSSMVTVSGGSFPAHLFIHSFIHQFYFRQLCP